MSTTAAAARAPRPAGGAGVQVEALFEERAARFAAFLDHGIPNATTYKQRIVAATRELKRRVVVNVNDLREYDVDLSIGCIEDPTAYIPAFERAVNDVAQQLSMSGGLASQSAYSSTVDNPMHVGFEGSFGEHYVDPRTLQARMLGKMICIEGIVTRCSLVRPKVRKSLHHCEQTQMFYTKEYRDSTMLGAPTGNNVYPQEDTDGNKLTTEYGWSVYQDHQTISIQEMPERAPEGQLPRSIDVILDDDLSDRVKPGDRIQLVGIYISVGGAQNGGASGVFKTLILGNNVRSLAKDLSKKPTFEEVGEMRNLVKQRKGKVFELLAGSLAPSIWGHENIKKAVLLMLLGGVEKNLDNGTHIRGDINILMVGDPSTAKSQLLRFVLNTSPLAIATTGRGSSGVGLTAAVTSDKETGERRLEAGAMVLADRGVVCIDEFDKMSDDDRVAIHEVMEQQTVTIAKAGIHTSLNARCSVFAASNPFYGYLVRDRPLHRQISLPDSLLSRFDVIFAVRDEVEASRDRAISMHVLRMHRYVPPGYEEGTPIPDAPQRIYANEDPYDQANELGAGKAATHAKAEAAANASRIYEKYNPLIHGKERQRQRRTEILKLEFLKKFIAYARLTVKPVLTPEASEAIGQMYSNLRQKAMLEGQSDRNALPVTPRLLETLIRLSTAHAKCRLSTKVEDEDVKAATQILQYAFDQDEAAQTNRDKVESRKKARVDKNGKKKKSTKHRNGNASSENDDDDEGSFDGSSSESDGEGSESDGSSSDADDGHGDAGGDNGEDATRPRRQTAGYSQRLNQTTSDNLSDLIRNMTTSDVPGMDPSTQPHSQQEEEVEPSLSEERFLHFRATLQKCREVADMGAESIPVEELLAAVNKHKDGPVRFFDMDEAELALARMATVENALMLADGTVYWV